ncbi:MAG: hypothetical protein N4A41_08025 [Crocinitomicaceae bacterium]|jgi:hypothetical protein|nr:hypothetical protein [Crocinitomicaceae bacterium]
MEAYQQKGTTLGTLTGVAFVIAGIEPSAYVQTIILACLGAIISFGTTLLLKALFKRWKKDKP